MILMDRAVELPADVHPGAGPRLLRGADGGARRPADRVNREEVFGPFVSVLTFRGERQALELANAVDDGLGGGLWTRDLRCAHRPAAAIRSGMVWVNVDAELPAWYPRQPRGHR